MIIDLMKINKKMRKKEKKFKIVSQLLDLRGIVVSIRRKSYHKIEDSKNFEVQKVLGFCLKIFLMKSLLSS